MYHDKILHPDVSDVIIYDTCVHECHMSARYGWTFNKMFPDYVAKVLDFMDPETSIKAAVDLKKKEKAAERKTNLETPAFPHEENESVFRNKVISVSG